MHTHKSQGYGSRCLVKAEENLFEYKQRALLETIYSYLHVITACYAETQLRIYIANLRIEV